MMTGTEATYPAAPRSGRTAKTLGWCFGALIVAVVMSFAADILITDVLDAAIDPFTDGAIVPDPVTAMLTALLVGGSTGALIGNRVPQRPVIAACAVIAAFLFLWPLSFLGIASGAWVAVSIVAHFVFAAAAAHIMSTYRGRKTVNPAGV